MTTGKQVFSTITKGGQLELSVADVETPTPGPDDVIVRIEAAPINPSDMGPLFGPASIDEARVQDAKLVAPVPKNRMGMVASRVDQKLPVGNECAGTVISTGDNDAAKALDGKLVSIMPGASFAQYACVPAATCLVHNDKTTPQRAASSFVNPLTALCFLETMRMENHTGLLHTAAASNLGQMLVRLCAAEDVPLVNIVRSEDQAATLRTLGAKYICNSGEADFLDKLTETLIETGITLGFDAIGGGQIASDILTAMERAASRNATGLNSYGSSQLKQVYLYGSLDFSPTTLNRAYGMAWSVGGWLMPLLLARIGRERTEELRQRVSDEINTIFASEYTAELSLQEMITPEAIARYLPKKTGEKYLVTPQKDL
jgi:NADPH:quinone reductase-like Zn-dependent oxidoreductase